MDGSDRLTTRRLTCWPAPGARTKQQRWPEGQPACPPAGSKPPSFWAPPRLPPVPGLSKRSSSEVSNVSLLPQVPSSGVAVGRCQRFGDRLVDRARRCRAWLGVALPSWLDPLLALGLLALTRLGLNLFDRAVLDFLGLALMGQAGDGELLVFLAALDPACLQGRSEERRVG